MISIIIVNWNGKKWLKRCFDSLVNQTYKDFEIVFVDNNSSDDSIEYLTSNYKIDNLNIVKSDRNLGFSGGNNLGIKNAKGEHILLLNNDVWFENDFIERLFGFYKNNDFDVIGPSSCGYDESKPKNSIAKIDFLGHMIQLDNDDKRKESFYLSGVCLLFLKKFYQETLGLDDDFFMYVEEIDWFWRLHLLGKKIGKLDDLFLYHAGSGSTGEGIKYNLFLWRNQNALQMLVKNYAWFNLVWVLPLYIFQNIIEMVFFLLIGMPKISYSYIEGWMFNIKSIGRILGKRKWVQKNRKASDLEIMKKMYFGLAKLHHLIGFYKKNEESV